MEVLQPLSAVVHSQLLFSDQILRKQLMLLPKCNAGSALQQKEEILIKSADSAQLLLGLGVNWE